MIALGAIAKYLMKTSLFQKNNILFFNKPYATRTDPLGNEGKRMSSMSEISFHEWLGGQWVFFFDCNKWGLKHCQLTSSSFRHHKKEADEDC
jgi:hypothetical protein